MQQYINVSMNKKEKIEKYKDLYFELLEGVV